MRDSLPWKLFMELEKDSRSALCGFKIYLLSCWRWALYFSMV